jgi:chemotaxis protein MotB
MIDARSRTRALGFCVSLALCAGACGPSEQELLLRSERDALQRQLAEVRQHNDDLKLRMQLAEARNRVLTDLVHGLTSDGSLGEAETSLTSLDKNLQALVESVRHSKQDMEAQRAQRKSLEGELGEARRVIEETKAAQADATARAEALRSMLAQLSALIDHGDLDVRIVDNRMLLQLPEAVLFESNDARVKRTGKVVLDRVAEVLLAMPSRSFQIAGHTDALPVRYGKFHDNWELSAARAIDVTQHLIARGVPKKRISAAAHADTVPLTQGQNPAQRRQNRRIEIVLLPNLDELPDLSQLEALLQKDAPKPTGDKAP